jgi:hypothetical protein
MPQINNNTVIYMASVKMGGDKVQKQCCATSKKLILEFKETHSVTAISSSKFPN